MDTIPQAQHTSGRPGSVLSKAAGACRRNGGAAVAIIVVLIVTVAYLLARLKGWGGRAGRSADKAPAATGRKGAAGGRAPARAADRDEIDSLIAEIQG